MLPDDQLKLLTAAVDGELSPADGLRVHRLLAGSAAARTLLAKLEADRAWLRALPAIAPPAGLVTRVMSRLPKVVPPAPVPATTPAPAAAPLPFRSPRARTWVPVAVAASLFLVLGSAAFFSLVGAPRPHPNAAGHAKRATHAEGQPAEPSFQDVLPRDSAPLPSAPAPRHEVQPETVANLLPGPTPPTIRDELPPPRPVPPADVFGGNPLAPLPPLVHQTARVPFLALFASVSRDDVGKRLAEELGRDPAYRADLFGKDPARAADLFQTVAREAGVTLFADAFALDRIKRKQASAYLVYTEALTAAEVRDLFARLAAADAKAAPAAFDFLHLSPAQPADLKELKDALGTDPLAGKRPHPVPAVEPKPISANTGDQVAKSLTGTAPKGGEKSAVLLTFAPTAARTPPAMSKELKQYLDRRGDRKPGVVPMAVVIRTTAG